MVWGPRRDRRRHLQRVVGVQRVVLPSRRSPRMLPAKLIGAGIPGASPPNVNRSMRRPSSRNSISCAVVDAPDVAYVVRLPAAP